MSKGSANTRVKDREAFRDRYPFEDRSIMAEKPKKKTKKKK